MEPYIFSCIRLGIRIYINLKFIKTRCRNKRSQEIRNGVESHGVQYTARFLAGEWENSTSSRSRVGGLSFQQWAGFWLAIFHGVSF